MENFFIEDSFYHEISDLLDHYDIVDEQTLNDFLGDGTSVEVTESESQPVFALKLDEIMDLVDPERLPEDDDKHYELISNLLKKHINFDAINAEMPQLLYGTRKKATITREELMDYL